MLELKNNSKFKKQEKQPRFTIEPNQLSPIAAFSWCRWKKLRQALMLNLRQLVTQWRFRLFCVTDTGNCNLRTRQPALPLSYAELVEFFTHCPILTARWEMAYQVSKTDSMIYSKLTTLLQSLSRAKMKNLNSILFQVKHLLIMKSGLPISNPLAINWLGSFRHCCGLSCITYSCLVRIFEPLHYRIKIW